MFVKGFFIGDGSSGIYKNNSGIKYYCHIKILDFGLIQKLQRFCRNIWDDMNIKIYDIRETSNIYRISSSKIKLALELDEFCAKDKEKRIPCIKLKETVENRKWFRIGFYAADGNRRNKRKNISFSQKNKTTMSSLNYL